MLHLDAGQAPVGAEIDHGRPALGTCLGKRGLGERPPRDAASGAARQREPHREEDRRDAERLLAEGEGGGQGGVVGVLGALCYASEGIVAALYSHIEKGLLGAVRFEKSALVFFDLHIRVDDGHANGLHPARAQRLVGLEPFHEANQRMLMRLLALKGETAAALARYRQLRAMLASELAAEPEDATTALFNQIRRGDTAGLRPPSPALVVPLPPTPLVGRSDEVLAVCAHLRDMRVRAVTITGAGGIGKTRLAIGAAAGLAAAFPGGVAFVGLAAIRDPALVVPTIAHALGLADLAAAALVSRLPVQIHADQAGRSDPARSPPLTNGQTFRLKVDSFFDRAFYCAEVGWAASNLLAVAPKAKILLIPSTEAAAPPPPRPAPPARCRATGSSPLPGPRSAAGCGPRPRTFW